MDQNPLLDPAWQTDCFYSLGFHSKLDTCTTSGVSMLLPRSFLSVDAMSRCKFMPSFCCESHLVKLESSSNWWLSHNGAPIWGTQIPSWGIPIDFYHAIFYRYQSWNLLMHNQKCITHGNYWMNLTYPQMQPTKVVARKPTACGSSTFTVSTVIHGRLANNAPATR